MSFRANECESRNLLKQQVLSCVVSSSNVVDSSTPLCDRRNDRRFWFVATYLSIPRLQLSRNVGERTVRPPGIRIHECANQFLNWLVQLSTGELHLDGFDPGENAQKTGCYFRSSLFFVVTRRGIEPRTHCLKGSCSAN